MIWMTVNFLDLWIIDPDTIAFLLGVIPGLYWKIMVGGALFLMLMALVWRIDTVKGSQ